uniref:Uncharacterized protein n=1 Tax=Romanomermis culicivorax TaxID=13658 RepID=A0A915IZJ7_ROMCU
MRRRAVKSAAEWNNEINKERKMERNKFFEHQTMLIHYVNRKSKSDNVETNFGIYPVALMSGQYQNFYKNFSTTELNRLPVNTVIDTEIYCPIRDCSSPEAIVVSEANLLMNAIEFQSLIALSSSSSRKVFRYGLKGIRLGLGR